MKRLILAAALLSCSALLAQENSFSVDAQLRGRGEVRSGVLDPTATNLNTSAFINERVRLGINYSNNDWLTMRVAGQHTGVWGQTSQNPVNTGDFNINEAWAKLSFGQVYFKLGRQALVYDDERLLGGLDWHVAGRYHDLGQFGVASRNGAHRFELSAAFNQNAPKTAGGTYFATGGQPYKTMQTLWYHYGSKPFSVSALFMNLGFENGTAAEPSQRFMQTFGAFLNCRPGIFSIDFSAYYQTGKSTAMKPINAWMFAFKGTAKVCDAFNAALGLDWLSGASDGESYTAFDPLYGTHHKFYGLIDYWYVNRNSDINYGLVDPYLTLTFSPAANFNAALSGHFFLNDSNGGVKLVTPRQYKATELDLQLTWKIKDCLTLMGGWSGFFGSKNFYSEYEFINTAVSNPNRNQNWVWLQLNIVPKIFQSKW